VAKWQILLDPINIGRPQDFGFAQRSPSTWTFALQQMSPARAAEQDFARASYLEAFCH
jgi:hypothetical protein